MDSNSTSSSLKKKWIKEDMLEKHILNELLPRRLSNDEEELNQMNSDVENEMDMRNESGALVYLYLDGIFARHFPPYVPDYVIRLIENSRKDDLTHTLALLTGMKENNYQFTLENLKKVVDTFVKEDMSWDRITSFFKLIFGLIVFARKNEEKILYKNIPAIILHFMQMTKDWIAANNGWTTYT